MVNLDIQCKRWDKV